MSKNYLNVVSAGVMAFGTLALGLVTVLPMASAANAETAAGAANAQGMYNQTNENGDPVGITVDTSSTSSSSDDSASSDTDDNTTTPEGMYATPNNGCPGGYTWNEDQYTCLPGVNVESETPKPETPKPEVKPEVKPEKPAKKNAETPVVTPESNTQPSADKGTAAEGAAKDAPKDAPKGQQQVKKGHHKFGAPNTGYEF